MMEHTNKHTGNGKRQAKREKEIGKERANKTARVKWGERKMRGK